jgi:hypothetical protein
MDISRQEIIYGHLKPINLEVLPQTHLEMYFQFLLHQYQRIQTSTKMMVIKK